MFVTCSATESDDAMARDCLATVQSELDGRDRLLVTFPEGLMIDRTGGVFAAKDDRGAVRSFGEGLVGALPGMLAVVVGVALVVRGSRPTTLVEPAT